MKTIRTVLIIIIGLIILTGIGAGIGYIKLKKDYIIMTDNFNQVASKIPDKNLILTTEQLEDYIESTNDQLMKELIDGMNLKFKHIVQTYDNKYSYNYDTTIHINYDYTMPQTTFKRFKYQPDSCINIEGKIDWQKDSLTFEIFDVNIDSKTIYYKVRTTKKGKRIFWPFGKKDYHAVSTNNCTGQTETTRITIKDE